MLKKRNSGENKIRHEVEKIAAWISSESKRNHSQYKKSLINAEKFPAAPKLRWHLGVRSFSDPVDIMMKIFGALKILNFEWHSISPYHLVIRPLSGENKVKIKRKLWKIINEILSFRFTSAWVYIKSKILQQTVDLFWIQNWFQSNSETVSLKFFQSVFLKSGIFSIGVLNQ